MAGQLVSGHALRAARTYGAAADHYSLPSLGFWDRFGAATVSRLRLAAGASVLDLYCGAGASAICAAHAVGPGGAVLGIDVALPLLELARDRAAREGLANIEFRPGDAVATGLPDGGPMWSSVPRGGRDDGSRARAGGARDLGLSARAGRPGTDDDG
jgi:ubiquinone/menaquinone biosynthesis C-methylase UbiE